MEKLCFWNLDNNLDNRLWEQKEVVINKIYAHVPKQNIWKKGKAQSGFSGDNSFTYLHWQPSMSFFHQLPLEGYNLRDLTKEKPKPKISFNP